MNGSIAGSGSSAVRRYLPRRKAGFAGPQQVLDYVGRYTHRVAISNHRLLNIDGGHVRFQYKDYRAQDQRKTMTLAGAKFIRRFLLHVLPAGFHRIRYSALLGNPHRTEKLARCRHLLGLAAPVPIQRDGPTAPTDYRDRAEALTGSSLRACPTCHHGHMIVIERLVPARRAVLLIPDTS